MLGRHTPDSCSSAGRMPHPQAPSRLSAASKRLAAEHNTFLSVAGPPNVDKSTGDPLPDGAPAFSTTDGSLPLLDSRWTWSRRAPAATAAVQMSPPSTVPDMTTAKSSPLGSLLAPKVVASASATPCPAAGGFSGRLGCGQGLLKGTRGKFKLCRAKLSVFFKSMAIVIGPTPPGTGVMCAATPCASAKFTSPTKRWPNFLVASSTALMPTSMTTQPGFSHSPRTYSARPTAATTMSALRTWETMSCVREWQTVTVASMD
mmetsp:Transcript_11284/g.30262  ORF Transcript_11284/g.30262 Transcript_11284/m.30262 type:complete len:260 (-) Transcript_11284:765-1544(-)